MFILRSSSCTLFYNSKKLPSLFCLHMRSNYSNSPTTYTPFPGVYLTAKEPCTKVCTCRTLANECRRNIISINIRIMHEIGCGPFLPEEGWESPTHPYKETHD